MWMKRTLYFLWFLIFQFFNFRTEAQVNLQNGLVARYDFNSNVNDLTGNNHDGTIVNTLRYTEDRFGNPNSAIKFNGDGSYIKINDDGKFSTPQISISLWFKSNSDDLQVLIGKRKFEDDGTPSGGAQYQFFINYDLYPGIGSNLVGNTSSCTNATSSSYINSVDPICSERWYHAVITYDGTYHKIYINGVLKRNEACNFNSFLQCSSELRLGIWWALDKRPFNGLMDDVRWYNRSLTKDEVLALYDNYTPSSSSVKLDFSYLQNVCSPKTIQFSSSDPAASNYMWDFGNGITSNASPNPSVTYNSYGNYTVKLISNSKQGCSDTTEKTIPVIVSQSNVVLTRDTTICSGTSLKLATDSGISFCWKPDPSISNPNIANATVTPTANTTYYFTTQVESNNLVVNGDFSQGNTGFTSDYSAASPNTKEAEYYIANDSYTWNANFNSCVEHTTGTGKMMMVNGSSVAGSKVWGESISVSPNTNYSFSAWVESLAALNPANLRFSINGIALGDNINAGNVACQWKQFFTTWNSGNASTATITIVNNNTIADGNDFALDDISFSKVFLNQDSVKVHLTPPPAIRSRPDTAICEGTSIQLNAAGGTIYSWSPAAGLSNPNDQNPVAKPTVTTSYIVSAYNDPGCIGTDTVQVEVLKSPDISLSNDTTICNGTKVQLMASGGTKYQWTPVAGLNADNISNPTATPADTTNYFVTVTNANGCSRKDSVMVRIAQNPTVTTISNTSDCEGAPVTLQTSSSAGVRYSWYPGTALSDSTIESPVANPLNTVDYIITAKTTANCEAKDTVRITVLKSPTVTTSNDTTLCNGGTAPLLATGGVNYKWTPVAGLSDPNVSNPVASIDRTTTYSVVVISANGCSKSDSVKLSVRPLPVFKVQPTTKTVCEKDTISLIASGGDVYDWVNAGSVVSPNSAVAIVKPDTNTIYKVRIYDSVCNLADTLEARITVNPLPAVSIRKSNDIDCSFTTATLTASGGEKYSWTPSGQINNTNIPNPVVSPVTTGYFKVKVTDAKGCSNSDSIKVIVNFNSLANRFELPTAFTPNNDGKNDCFGVKSWGPLSQLDFSIFNRWGERVFYTKNPSDCWDGTYKNLQQNTGGFVYYIKARSVCGGDFEKKGSIALIR